MISKGNSNYIIECNEKKILKTPINKSNLKKNILEFENHKKIFNLYFRNKDLFTILYIPKPIKYIPKKGYIMERISGELLELNFKQEKVYYKNTLSLSRLLTKKDERFVNTLMKELGLFISMCNFEEKILTWDCELILNGNRVALIDFDKIGKVVDICANSCYLIYDKKPIELKIEDSFVEDYYPNINTKEYNYFKKGYMKNIKKYNEKKYMKTAENIFKNYESKFK